MSSAARLWDEAAKCRRSLAHTADAPSRAALAETIAELEHQAMRLTAEEREAPPLPARCEFHVPVKGERWFIDAGTSDQPHIVHQIQSAPVQKSTELDLQTFMSIYGPDTPQHQALLRFISQIVEKCADPV